MSRPERHPILKGTRHIDPNRVVGTTVLNLEGTQISLNLIWDQLDLLDRSQLGWWATSARQSLVHLERLVVALEALAEGREALVCPQCSERFYPSRSDARFCSGRCRMRAHRPQGAPADTVRTAGRADTG